MSMVASRATKAASSCMSGVRSFDRVAEIYDETRGGLDRGRQYAAELLPRFGTSGLTLEVGIGTGLVAKGLAELGRSVCGVDVAPLMLRQARERIGNRVVAGLAECMPVRTDAFDDAYSVWVLHLVDVDGVLAEVARVLRPGGRYLVSPAVVPEPDPITDTTKAMYEAIHGTLERPDDPDALAKSGEAVGLRLIERRSCASQRFLQSPATEADRIAARSGAALWDLDDDRWEEIVEPAIRALRALPDAAVEIERVALPEVLVFELHGG